MSERVGEGLAESVALSLPIIYIYMYNVYRRCKEGRG